MSEPTARFRCNGRERNVAHSARVPSELGHPGQENRPRGDDLGEARELLLIGLLRSVAIQTATLPPHLRFLRA